MKEILKGSDVEKIKKAMEELTKVSHKLAEEIYKSAREKQQAQQPKGQPDKGQKNQGAEEPKSKKDDDVVDAEYKVEGEDKDKGKK